MYSTEQLKKIVGSTSTGEYMPGGKYQEYIETLIVNTPRLYTDLHWMMTKAFIAGRAVAIHEERERRRLVRKCCAIPLKVPTLPPDADAKVKNNIAQVVGKINDEASLMRIYKFIVRLYMKELA